MLSGSSIESAAYFPLRKACHKAPGGEIGPLRETEVKRDGPVQLEVGVRSAAGCAPNMDKYESDMECGDLSPLSY